MFKSLLAGVDKTLVRNLVILHTLVIAVSNYLVTIRFDLFPGADLPLFGSFPLAAAAFTFPIVVVATDYGQIGRQRSRKSRCCNGDHSRNRGISIGTVGTG